MNKKIKPVIKWTGGKYSEFALFADRIPSFDRYIEPFFGGGGVFFALQPGGMALLNDKSKDLINFYREVGHEELRATLLQYASAWDELAKFASATWPLISAVYVQCISQKEHISRLENLIDEPIKLWLKTSSFHQDENFILDPGRFETFLVANTIDKAKRIQRICSKENKDFNDDELFAHFETGLKSGFYLFFRTLMNENAKAPLLSRSKAAANWYFVREFCYGSMFRYNAKGEFNIPYGGITYNRKNFRQKIENIFRPEMIELFGRATFHNEDFEEFLKKINLQSTDFIFLDPPYDSEFSEYDQNAFTKADQVRLADYLLHATAKWMVVIKETPFIRSIYTHPHVKISTFGKSYSYNVRGRNNRMVQHLIITNY